MHHAVMQTCMQSVHDCLAPTPFRIAFTHAVNCFVEDNKYINFPHKKQNQLASEPFKTYFSKTFFTLYEVREINNTSCMHYQQPTQNEL